MTLNAHYTDGELRRKSKDPSTVKTLRRYPRRFSAWKRGLRRSVLNRKIVGVRGAAS